MDWWIRNVPTLRDAAQVLRRDRVLYAHAKWFGELPTRLFVTVSSGWAYGGLDGALSVLEAAISGDPAHVNKLAASSAAERHLWYWTDAATTDDFRSAFDPRESQLVPERDPVLPDAVTDLWCVDEEHGRGWRWSPTSGWAAVTADDGD
jgi:hypothetical protein